MPSKRSVAKDSKGKQKVALVAPSSNWLALKATLPKASKPPAKKRRINSISVRAEAIPIDDEETNVASTSSNPIKTSRKGDDVAQLRAMILSPVPSGSTPVIHTDVKIGQYLALDCEMVGVGAPTVDQRTGKVVTESSLARVSLVNYHGEVVLDAFVKQKERVTDFRTFVSGVRAEDLVGNHAMLFEDVQKQVADLIKGRILVGHAVFNDLKALMLKHSSASIRDTQKNAAIRAAYRTNRAGLRTVIQREFDIDIQAGEHSSVIDARATMALYRLYKDQTPVKNEADTSKLSAMPFIASKRAHRSSSSSMSEDDELTDAEQSLADSEEENSTEPAETRPSAKTRKRELEQSIAAKTSKLISKAAMTADGLILHVASPSATPLPRSSPVTATSTIQSIGKKSQLTPNKGAKLHKKTRSSASVAAMQAGGRNPGGGRKGISSGLSTVVRAGGRTVKITGKGAPARTGNDTRKSSSGNVDSGGNAWWASL